MEQLIRHLNERQAFLSSDTMNQLEDRKREEIEFHNVTPASIQGEAPREDGPEGKPLANKKYYKTTQLSHEYIETWLGENCPGKIFLDYACGEGQMTLNAVRQGARLGVGLDISDGRIRHARNNAAKAGLAGACYFIQGDCENTGLPEASFDVILCSGMLHHLDLSYALPEIRRILKPGGKAFAIEAFGENPVIQAYRNRTPELRTAWEKDHILKYRDLEFIARFLAVENVRFWHMISPLAAFLPRPLFERGLAVCNRLDLFLTRAPLLKRWSWQVTFEMVKRP